MIRRALVRQSGQGLCFAEDHFFVLRCLENASLTPPGDLGLYTGAFLLSASEGCCPVSDFVDYSSFRRVVGFPRGGVGYGVVSGVPSTGLRGSFV